MDDSVSSQGLSWRSSRKLVLFTAILGLFTENFLYGFIVPILPYMIEVRLRLDPSYTQRLTTELLVMLGLISIPTAPFIGQMADKTSSRKIPLLISLVGCTIGTLLVAFTPSLWVVYVGRVFQGVSGTGAWIVAFAMLTDATGSKHVGKALGLAGSFVTGGVLMGPAVAGVLLELFGYWQAWSVPLTLLVIGFLSRLAMVEVEKSPRAQTEETRPSQSETHGGRNENEPLLSTQPYDVLEATEEVKAPSPRGFWGVVLREGSVYAALFNIVAFAMLLSGFDATLPLHLRDAFGWTSAPIGSIFLALQVPGMLLGPFIGWLRDRIGLRYPTSLGWGLTAPLLWFCGVPGPDNFLGVGAGPRGQAAFVTAMIGTGIVLSFARGSGTFQLITTLHELRERNPEIFGPGGGGSRMFSLTEVSFSTGLLLGPLICGSLADLVGFYYTTFALAITSLGVAIVSFALFTHKTPVREPLGDESNTT